MTTNSIARALRPAPVCKGEALEKDLDRLRHCEHGRLQSQQTPVRYMIDRRSQAAVVVILERDEAERLQHSARRLLQGAENFSHAVHRTRLRLKCEFDERSGSKRMLQLQQPAGYGNGLKFSFSAPAVF